jgi:cyclopropane-fatty-acyl-phospholipid synthase
MARHYGVRVRAFNISHEQIVYARERAKREGLTSLVEYVEDDYRNISGRYDAFVSVGMLEHVGLDNYPTLGRVAQQSLDSRGRGLIHSIGCNRPVQLNPWIEKRIFPGAYHL